MNDKEKAAPVKDAALEQIRTQFSGTSGRTQCDRLLAALHLFPLTTYEGRRWLDVYDMPARVLQLRKAGHRIITLWQTVITEAGEKHRVGLYVLQREDGHA